MPERRDLPSKSTINVTSEALQADVHGRILRNSLVSTAPGRHQDLLKNVESTCRQLRDIGALACYAYLSHSNSDTFFRLGISTDLVIAQQLPPTDSGVLLASASAPQWQALS